MPSRAVLAVALLLTAPPLLAERLERVLAVVDGVPVLLSETRALQRLKPTDLETARDALIDEFLMLREAIRLREAAATPDEEQRAYQGLLEKLPPDGAGGDADALRRIAWRQTVIVKYIELRFRPQVRIDEAELQQAYDEQYAGRPDAPPLPQVSQRLLEQLRAAALDKRIEAWVAELRAAARIRLNPEPQS
jgi:hypothetical protein